MSEDGWKPELVYVEHRAMGLGPTRAILDRWPTVPVVPVASHLDLPCEMETPAVQKRRLALAVKRGEAVKPFPCDEAPGTEPAYFIMHAAGCVYDCRYCFLQSYFQHAVPVVYVNVDEIAAATQAVLHRLGGQPARFHAGQMSDALLFERLTGVLGRLARLFAGHPRAVLEARTKVAAVDGLERLEPRPNVVPAWTLTPPAFAGQAEPDAPSIPDRLAAAARAQQMGFRVGLRLDPVIRLPGWRQAYDELVALIVERLDPAHVADVVLGSLRFNKALERAAASRFPESRLYLDEFVPGADGKWRYFRPVRVALYRHILAAIRRRAPGLRVALSMETAAVHEACRDLIVP